MDVSDRVVSTVKVAEVVAVDGLVADLGAVERHRMVDPPSPTSLRCSGRVTAKVAMIDEHAELTLKHSWTYNLLEWLIPADVRSLAFRFAAGMSWQRSLGCL